MYIHCVLKRKVILHAFTILYVNEYSLMLYWSNNNQRTNGPVNAHLISWPSKAQNIQIWKIYGKEMTLTFYTHITS